MIETSLERKPHLSYRKEALSPSLYAGKIDSVTDSRSASNPQLSVSVVAYNEGDDCVRLVDKLLELGDKIEIILVDNGLDEGTAAQLIKRPICYIKSSDNHGPSMGRNITALYAKADLISFLDADGMIDSDFADIAIKTMLDNPEVVCARGKVVSPQGTLYQPAHYDLGNAQIIRKPDTEGILVFRLKDYVKVGGFEDELYAGEGVVLCYRMIEAYNYKLEAFIYEPKLVLRHDYADKSKLAKKARRGYINTHHINTFYPLLHETLKPLSEGNQLREGFDEIRDKLAQIKSETSREIDDFYRQLGEEVWAGGGKIAPERPKFTVVLPCYNLGEHVTEAVKSILSQSLDDVEIIVVDDVSTDLDTKQVLRDLSSRVKVIYHEENGGASAARNTGIKAAKSDYILCLDSDDTISPTYLEEAYNVLENLQDVDIVSCHVKLWGGRNGVWRPIDKVSLQESLISSPIPNASCYRKSIWQKAGGYDESMRGMEDWEYWLSCLEAGAKIRVLPRQHYYYYVRPGSKVTKSNKNAVEIVSYIVDKHREAFESDMTFQIAKRHRLILAEREKYQKLEEKLRISRSLRGRLLGGDYELLSPSTLKDKVRRGARVVLVERDMKHLKRTLRYYRGKLRE